MTVAINLAKPGLANRIKTYVSCLSKFDEVRTMKESDNYIFENIKLATEEEFSKYPHFDNWRFVVEEAEFSELSEYRYIDLLYEKTPQYFINKYLPIFNSLSINKDILEYVNEFENENNLKNCIGLHIRSWYCDRKSWHTNELFEKALDSLKTDQKIFLCSDSKSVVEYFSNKYKDKIVSHEQERYNHPHLAESGHNDSIQTNVDAFIDLLLLSKCDTIIGTYASTFPEVAWWFGNCKSKVLIPKPLNIPDEFNNRIFEKL